MGLTRRMFAGVLGGAGLLTALLKTPAPAAVPVPVKDQGFRAGQRLLVTATFTPDDEPVELLQDGGAGHIAIMIGETAHYNYPLKFTLDPAGVCRVLPTFMVGSIRMPSDRDRYTVRVVLVGTASGRLAWKIHDPDSADVVGYIHERR